MTDRGERDLKFLAFIAIALAVVIAVLAMAASNIL